MFNIRASAFEKRTLKFIAMKVGDRIRIKESVLVYHNPEHRNQPFDLKGMEGDVLAIVTEWQGRPVSANLPIQVQFNKKFRAHLKEGEVELV
jgi:Ferredoxin thioredoxin reductase variable alpha chain